MDLDPLCQVVRDTVGRHDSFALACQAKYYEDMGYPGHVNCTDNFNGALEPYPIAARKGWPALNFFFNTAFDRDNLLISDEPWSRPGDYVMLRALTDLVCASSACPDDIDPSNGWEVTDVHVRVYSPENRFSQAIARRVTADSEAELDARDRLPPAQLRAHEELRGVPRLLAAPLLQQRGRRGRVLGLPRAVRGDGPLAAAQVGGARARRRAVPPAHRHAQHPQAGHRAGRLHGGVQRDGRHDRRRHRVPPRRQQLPLRRRRPLRRRVAARAGEGARPEGQREGLHRPAAQPRGSGAEQPRPDAELSGRRPRSRRSTSSSGSAS